jgi:hypothetical protein
MDLTMPCRPRSQLEPEIADDRGSIGHIDAGVPKRKPEPIV